MTVLSPSYPTRAHGAAAQAITDFFAGGHQPVDAVLLTNSCARGRATPDSCLDVAVLAMHDVRPRTVEREWQRFYDAEPVFQDLRAAGRFSVVHLEVFTGTFRGDQHPDDEFPDAFEVEIGNLVRYAVPLWERTDRWERLRARWLPYYDEASRRERLARVRANCVDALGRVPPLVARGLYFAAFDQQYRAFQMLLQAVFIARRTYPLAYNKWVREQVVEILELPELYAALPALLETPRLESDALVEKAAVLRELLDRYAPAEGGGV